MPNLTHIFPIPLVSLSLLATACTKAHAPLADTASPTYKPQFASQHVQTVKPGAAVSITGTQSAPILAGQTGQVELEIIENYAAGILTLEAVGDDAVDVFGAERTLRLDMASDTHHSWTVPFRAETDGIYYISIQATAAPEDGPVMTRAFAVKVEVGDTSNAAAKIQEDVSVETLASGEAAVIMDADETIK